MNPVIENILTRRSVRKFTDKKIAKEDLEVLCKAALCAPSGMDKQTWQFTVVADTEKIQALAQAVGKALDRENYNMYKPAALIIPSNARDSLWGMEDNACALENIFLAAHALGIGSVWVNQVRHCCDEPEIRSILTAWGIPEDHVVYGIAALGYQDGEPQGEVEKIGVVKFVE